LHPGIVGMKAGHIAVQASDFPLQPVEPLDDLILPELAAVQLDADTFVHATQIIEHVPVTHVGSPRGSRRR
jgi:hypothetical protein